MTLPAYAMNVGSFPQMYERLLVEPLFRPFAAALLDRIAPRDGERLLDIACGTGIVARLALPLVGATGRIVGTDISPQMLEVARSIAPDIDWRPGAADALPLRDGETFDIVTCHQGFQFFPDRAAAAREMRRALAPGGRLAIAAWRALETMPFVLDLHRVAERLVGPVTDRRHSMTGPGELEQVLSAAGFHDVQVENVDRTVRFGDGMVFVRLNAMALVGMSARSKELTDEARAELAGRIAEESRDVLGAYTTGDTIAFEYGMYLATAVAPR